MSSCGHGGGCKCGVAPFPIPKGCKVEPHPCKPLVLDDSEKYLFDSVAEEKTEIEGTSIDYYWWDQAASIVDPLYRETVKKVHRGPYKLKAYVTWPDLTAEVNEQGEKATFDITAWIARIAFEKAGCPPPQNGDVLRLWDNPFWNSHSTNDDGASGGLYFIVTDVDPTGMVNNSTTFVGFNFTLSRSSAYTPERRLDNS